MVFTKFGGKIAHVPRKKPLDFNGNPDHVTLRLGLRLWLLVTVDHSVSNRTVEQLPLTASRPTGTGVRLFNDAI